MEIPFNLNWKVRVKLSTRGYECLADFNNAFVGVARTMKHKTINDFRAEADASGYTTMQFHELFSYFGAARGILSDFIEDFNVLLVIDEQVRVENINRIAIGFLEGEQRNVTIS